MATAVMSGGGARRVAAALTSYFFHPEVDMRGYELLSCASAFLVPVARPDCATRFHVIAAAHVTHPWRFPAYYPPDSHAFVHVLSDEHIRCNLELRRDDGAGTVAVEGVLSGTSWVHPQRDLSVLHLADEPAFFNAARAAGLTLAACELAETPAENDEALAFVGHVLQPRTSSSSNSSSGDGAAAAPVDATAPAPLYPFATTGTLLGRSPRQVFARTAALLQMGMCGGPVLRASSVAGAGSGTPLAYGAIEGIVEREAGSSSSGGDTPSEDAAALQAKARSVLGGAAVFVESATIAAFLRAIEARLP